MELERGAVRAASTMSAVVAVAAMVTLFNISTKTGDTTGAREARPAILALACAVRWRWKLIISKKKQSTFQT